MDRRRRRRCECRSVQLLFSLWVFALFLFAAGAGLLGTALSPDASLSAWCVSCVPDSNATVQFNATTVPQRCSAASLEHVAATGGTQGRALRAVTEIAAVAGLVATTGICISALTVIRCLYHRRVTPCAHFTGRAGIFVGATSAALFVALATALWARFGRGLCSDWCAGGAGRHAASGSSCAVSSWHSTWADGSGLPPVTHGPDLLGAAAVVFCAAWALLAARFACAGLLRACRCVVRQLLGRRGGADEDAAGRGSGSFGSALREGLLVDTESITLAAPSLQRSSAAPAAPSSSSPRLGAVAVPLPSQGPLGGGAAAAEHAQSPAPHREATPQREASSGARALAMTNAALEEELTRQAEERCCPVCMDRRKDLAFGCGHLVCHECSAALDRCPVCRQPVASRIRLYG